MTCKIIFRTFSAALCIFVFSAMPVTSNADSKDAIKERIEARQPSLNALKSKGIIGENNKGFLAFVGSSKEGADIINAENADRSAVYAAIAKKQNTTAELVGARRAIQLAERAKAGEYIQNDKGVWIKK